MVLFRCLKHILILSGIDCGSGCELHHGHSIRKGQCLDNALGGLFHVIQASFKHGTTGIQKKNDILWTRACRDVPEDVEKGGCVSVNNLLNGICNADTRVSNQSLPGSLPRIIRTAGRVGTAGEGATFTAKKGLGITSFLVERFNLTGQLQNVLLHLGHHSIQASLIQSYGHEWQHGRGSRQAV